MLVPSPRHTPADLRLWVEMEEADLAYADACAGRLSRLEAESVGALASWHRRVGGYASTSHGKDSVVLWHLLHLAGLRLPVVHLYVTPSHNPHCDDVRDAVLARRPLPYAERRVDYGCVRSVDMDWESRTSSLFYGAFRDLDRALGGHASGIRAAEARRRAVRVGRWGLETERTCAPLGRWATQDVFAYLASRGLPAHPNYAMLGGGRWPREHLRVSELGDVQGGGAGRRQWEREYYGDVLNRLTPGSAG